MPKQIASFFDPLRAGIHTASRETTGTNIEVVFHSFPRVGEGEIDCLRKNHWQRFDGIIMVPGNAAELDDIAQVADKNRKPIIFVATDAARSAGWTQDMEGRVQGAESDCADSEGKS